MARPSTRKEVKRAAAPKKGRSRMSDDAVKTRTKKIMGLFDLPSRIPNYWSYSAYRSHRDCAFSYFMDRVLKIKQPGSKAMERGTTIHLLAESYLKGKTKGLPDELKEFRSEFANLRKAGAIAEGAWTLTRDGEITEGDDFARAWLRAKIDARLPVSKDGNLLIIDFKTGRFKVDRAQMELYAAMATHFEEFETVTVELWFVDHGEVESSTWTLAECEELWIKWKDRGMRMLSDREFKPSPATEQCSRCMYRSSNPKMTNGQPGPCVAWKEAK